MQADGLAHGVHLGHFGVVLLQSGPHGHGHFQTEGGTAGHPQLLQAENAVDEAGGEGQRQQGIHREAALQKVAQTVQHQIAAQQGGNQHCQHLAEDHQLDPVFRHQIQGEHGGNAGADEHHQHIDQQRGLQFADAHFGQLIVPPFRAGNQLLFQLLQTGAGGEHNGGGDEFLLHLKGRLCYGWLGVFLRQLLRQIHHNGRLVGHFRCFRRLFGPEVQGVGKRLFHRLLSGHFRFQRFRRFCLRFRRRCRFFFRLRIIEPQLGHCPGGVGNRLLLRVVAEFLQNVL